MHIYKAADRTDILVSELCRVWERSVRATHLFLKDKEIEAIAGWVPAALREVPHLIVAVNDKEEPVGFMGINGRRLEMLFLAPEERGHGIGKQLLCHGVADYSVAEVCVNEQNPQARAFYEHMGFRVYKRTDFDEQGNPYPLLYMSRV